MILICRPPFKSRVTQLMILHDLKRKFHPKKVILSFTQPQVAVGQNKFAVLLNTKKIYFFRMLVTKQLWGTIDYHSTIFHLVP